MILQYALRSFARIFFAGPRSHFQYSTSTDFDCAGSGSGAASLDSSPIPCIDMGKPGASAAPVAAAEAGPPAQVGSDPINTLGCCAAHHNGRAGAGWLVWCGVQLGIGPCTSMLLE